MDPINEDRITPQSFGIGVIGGQKCYCTKYMGTTWCNCVDPEKLTHTQM